MPKEKGLRIVSVDFLRIMCLLIVFLCHGWLLPSGNLRTIISSATGRALELFFIMSGCLTTISHSDHELKTIDFFIHELKKVYPEYLVAHICVFIYDSYLYTKGLYYETTNYWIYAIKKMIVSTLMLNSWIPKEDYIYAFNGVGWFLSSLMFCYLLTPFVLKKIKKMNNPVLLLFLIITIRSIYISIYHRSGSDNWLYWISVIPVYRMFEYTVGICVGLIFLERKRRINNMGAQVLCFLLYVIMIIIDCFVGGISQAFICFDVLLITGVILYKGVFDRIISPRFSKLLSKMMLPFYLFHQIVIKVYKYVCETYLIKVNDIGLIHMFMMFMLTLLVCAFDICIKKSKTEFRKTL